MGFDLCSASGVFHWLLHTHLMPQVHKAMWLSVTFVTWPKSFGVQMFFEPWVTPLHFSPLQIATLT